MFKIITTKTIKNIHAKLREINKCAEELVREKNTEKIKCLMLAECLANNVKLQKRKERNGYRFNLTINGKRYNISCVNGKKQTVVNAIINKIEQVTEC